MCLQYLCSKCSSPDWDRCVVAWEAGLQGSCCEFRAQTSQRHKCTVCHRISDVITKLQHLVFQEPWRLEGGPELEEWEKEAVEDMGGVRGVWEEGEEKVEEEKKKEKGAESSEAYNFEYGALELLGKELRWFLSPESASNVFNAP